jgi:flagellar basal-body rod protein FlgG
MAAQQAQIDTVAHNLANVNTAGFKKSRMEFADLVYEQVRASGSPTSTGTDAPTGLDVGLGTRTVSTTRDFSSGNLRTTSNPLDLALQGRGFFQVSLPDGGVGYTRAGSFHLSADGALVTADGYKLEPAITVPANATSLTIAATGIVSVSIAGQTASQQIGTIELASFQNPAGLTAIGGNIFTAATASGAAITGVPGGDGMGTIAQGFLEESNVNVVEEMVNMILAQRAYEANSRVVRAADEMLQQSNTMGR